MEAKRKAVERLLNMQPGKFKYQVLYTPASTIDVRELIPITDWKIGKENETTR